MSLWRRYLFGMLSGAGSVLIKTGLNIVLIPVMLAQLGLDAFGLFILLVGILELAMLLDLGLSNALVKVLNGEEVSQFSRQSYLKVGHLLFAALAGVFFIGGFLLLPWFDALFHIPPALQAEAPVALALVVLEATVMIYGCYYQSVLLAHCAHQWSNVADALYFLLSGLGAVFLLMLGFHLPEILLVRLGAATLRLLIMMNRALEVEPLAIRPNTSFSAGALKEMTHLGFHGMMINLSIIVSHKIDVILIGLFLPLGAIGVYELVFRFLGIAIQICLKMSEGSFPLFSRMAALGQRLEARQLFLRMSAFLALAAGMMVLLIVIFYGDLLDIFASGKVTREQTLPLLAVAAPIILSGVLQMPAGNWLFTWGHQRYLTVTSLLTAAANLVLSLVFVQWFGLLGVALGTLVPQLIQHQAFLIRTTCRELSISFRQYFGAVYGAVALPMLLVFLWSQLWQPLLGNGPMQLLAIGMTAVSGMLMGAGLWFALTATPMERDIARDLLGSRILQPLRAGRKKLMRSTSHG